MRVWIEQDYCTGDGLCEELCPQVFRLADDGLAHVVGEAPGGGPPGVEISSELEADALDAQGQCAGECIYTAASAL
ncbi:MAG TPA: ferredoxin [Acidimicrobiales bacterium]|nr:ferredoxin [Acidimicrobiales bacterium]